MHCLWPTDRGWQDSRLIGWLKQTCEPAVCGNERGHSGFPESVGSPVVSENAECPRFVGISVGSRDSAMDKRTALQ